MLFLENRAFLIYFHTRDEAMKSLYIFFCSFSIQDGRMTWLLVNAYSRANASQKAALEENYGLADNAEASAVVKQVYDDLNMKKIVSKDIDAHRQELMSNIQHISALSKETLSSKFFFQLLDNIGHMA